MMTLFLILDFTSLFKQKTITFSAEDMEMSIWKSCLKMTPAVQKLHTLPLTFVLTCAVTHL